MDGGDYLLKLTANGLVGGSKKTWQYQSDGDIDTGDGLNSTPYKEGYAWASRTSSGFKITAKALLKAPPGDALQLALDAYDNKGEVYAYYEADEVGSQYWHGKFRVVMTAVPGPVSGPFEGNFILSQSGLITRAVKT